MKCPVCSTVNLVMAERQGVEIDYCPECRGVWLDRGELDKIIERSSVGAATIQQQPQPQYQGQQHQGEPQHHGYRHDDHGHGHGGHKPYRKKSFLEELFD